MDPITATAATGLAVGAATSYIGARSQNKAIQEAQENQVQAARVGQQQVQDQAEIERLKAIRESNRIVGRLRVSAAEAGVGFGGSFSQLEGQAGQDLALNTTIIDRNRGNQIAAVRSGAAANLDSLASQIQSPALAAFGGGISGLSTGLSLGQGINDIGGEP